MGVFCPCTMTGGFSVHFGALRRVFLNRSRSRRVHAGWAAPSAAPRAAPAPATFSNTTPQHSGNIPCFYYTTRQEERGFLLVKSENIRKMSNKRNAVKNNSRNFWTKYFSYHSAFELALRCLAVSSHGLISIHDSSPHLSTMKILQ